MCKDVFLIYDFPINDVRWRAHAMLIHTYSSSLVVDWRAIGVSILFFSARCSVVLCSLPCSAIYISIAIEYFVCANALHRQNTHHSILLSYTS